MLGTIGGIENAIICDTSGYRFIIIRQFYFSAAHLPVIKPQSTTQTKASNTNQYRFYGDGGEGASIVVRIYRGKRRFNFVNSDNEVIFRQDFKQVKQFQNGVAYGYGFDGRYYQLRLDGGCVEYAAESIHLTQSDIRMIIESVIYRYKRSIDGAHSKQRLNEKYYNHLREPMIDGHIGDYEVLDGAKEEQILCDFPEKGWVEDIRMYSMMRKGGKTYCLFRRIDNGKYFFVEVYDEPCDKEYLHGKAVSKKDVPDFIWNDAISLTRDS